MQTNLKYASLFPRPVAMPVRKPDLRVGFILAPRFSLLPVASFLDALRHAADEADFSRQIYCTWKIIGPAGSSNVSSSCGIEVGIEATYDDPREFDHVIVAGGQLPYCLDVPQSTLDFIVATRRAGVGLVGLCTGSYILAEAGVLEGLRCSVHIEHERQFRILYPETTPVTDQLIVEDHGILSCPGGSTGLDLAFSIIRKSCGRARAVKALTSLMIGRDRTAEIAPDREYAYLTTCGHDKVEKALGIMESYLSMPFPISELASMLNISKSGLQAAFMRHAGVGPQEVWRNIRLSYSRWLLLNTNRAITQIAFECGFSDAAHFSRWFQRKFEHSPSKFRRKNSLGNTTL